MIISFLVHYLGRDMSLDAKVLVVLISLVRILLMLLVFVSAILLSSLTF